MKKRFLPRANQSNPSPIVPTLRRGNADSDAGALPDEFPRWSVGTRRILAAALPRVNQSNPCSIFLWLVSCLI